MERRSIAQPFLRYNSLYMQKLDPHNQFPVTKENIAQILSNYSISDFTFEPINEGIANTPVAVTSHGKNYVLRIYAQGKNPEHILFELKFQDLLKENGIPVPLVYQNRQQKPVTEIVNDGKTWHSILMEKIDGQSVTPHPSSVLIARLANLQATMHLLGIEFASQTGKPDSRWNDLRD